MQLEDKLVKQCVLIKLAKIKKNINYLTIMEKIRLSYTILPQLLWGNLL